MTPTTSPAEKVGARLAFEQKEPLGLRLCHRTLFLRSKCAQAEGHEPGAQPAPVASSRSSVVLSDVSVPPTMIEVRDLSKSYGAKLVIDRMSFTVHPGVVTGFLGPNGAGKSTTMRLIVGLDRPSGGDATIGGMRYADLPRPLRSVGALLDGATTHPGRSAFDHLLYLAQSQQISRDRVDEVLDLVGLRDVAHDRTGSFSLGMGQRLGLAAALLGDPPVLLLDEPVNGLDPDGILWIRNLLTHLAGEGRTILISSHLMSEMAATATHLIVIGRGRLITACTTEEFIEHSSKRSVLVTSPDAVALTDLITAAGGQVETDAEGELIVRLIDAAHIGALASHAGLELHQLTTRLASLEDAFMEQTHASAEFGGELPNGVSPALVASITGATS